jgi:hypothetical protein
MIQSAAGRLPAGEALAGPYVWGRYDLLLLPPSFPYGGMENPCLTFVTPTLLAGDRSLTNVVAHEVGLKFLVFMECVAVGTSRCVLVAHCKVQLAAC